MAYVTKDIEDEDEEQNGGTAGAQAAPARTGAPSAGMPAPQQTTPQQQKGTGFTNLSAWLDAGKGRDKAITNYGTGKINEEKGAFNAAAKPVEDASYQANNYLDGWTAGDAVSHAANGGGTADIERDLTQAYGGPKEINYDPNAQKNLWDVNSLTDANEAGQVLGRDSLNSGQYSQGAQALDRVLFGADADSQKAIGGVKDASKAFTGDVASRSEALKGKVAGFETAAENANKANREKLTDYGKTMSDKLDARVLGAKDSQGKIQAMLDADPTLLYPGNPGPTRDDPFATLQGGEMREITGGGDINRGNMVTGDEVKGFDVLAKVLGLPTVQKTGTYQDLGTKVTKDPNWLPPRSSGANSGQEPDYAKIRQMMELTGDQAGLDKLAAAWEAYGAKDVVSSTENPGERALKMKAFWDRFQRENMDFKIPTVEDVKAWDDGGGHAKWVDWAKKNNKHIANPEQAPRTPEVIEADERGRIIQTPAGAMTAGDWEKLTGEQATTVGKNKVKDDAASTLEQLKKQMPWLFGG